MNGLLGSGGAERRARWLKMFGTEMTDADALALDAFDRSVLEYGEVYRALAQDAQPEPPRPPESAVVVLPSGTEAVRYTPA